MGGKSSSSASTNTTTTQIDDRIAATDNASVSTIDGSNNTLSDHGAIESAGLLALEALRLQGEITLNAISGSNAALDTLGQGAETALNFADNATRDESQRTITELTPYLLVGVSILALTGALKGKF